jgi:hypothetical protein
MELAEHTFHLLDATQRWLGEIEIEQSADNLIFGAFTPGPDFLTVADMFQKFEDAVNVQALSVVDELEETLEIFEQFNGSPIRCYRIGRDFRLICCLKAT